MPELTSHEQENKEFIEWLDSKPSSLELALKGIQLITELNDLQSSADGDDKAWAVRRRADPRCSTPAGSGARFTPERIQKYRDDAINYGELTADDVNTILDEVEYLHFNMDSLAIGLKIAAVGKEIDSQRIALMKEQAGVGGLGIFADLIASLKGAGPEEDDDETPCDCGECCPDAFSGPLTDKEDDDS